MSNPNEVSLLPCPFCNGIADLAEDTDRPHNPWTAFCESCDARTRNCVEPDQAIAAWNTRTSAISDAAMLDWYEEHASQVVNLGQTWYWCKSYGQPHHKTNSMRSAIAAAMAAGGVQNE